MEKMHIQMISDFNFRGFRIRIHIVKMGRIRMFFRNYAKFEEKNTLIKKNENLSYTFRDPDPHFFHGLDPNMNFSPGSYPDPQPDPKMFIECMNAPFHN